MSNPILKIYVYKSKNKIGLGGNGKRVVAHFNTEAFELVQMQCLIFDSHKLLLKKPSNFANNVLKVRYQQFNLLFRHEDLEGEYNVIEIDPETFKLERIVT